MRGMGVKLLALSYSCTGALLGQLCALIFRRSDVLHEKPDLVLLVVLGNLVCLPALVLFFRRGLADPPLASPFSLIHALIHTRSVTNRVACFLFAAAWVLGLILGLWFFVRSPLSR
jgi:hypothetical protein